MEGLLNMADGDQILPFVRCFYGTPSTYLWEDEMGVTQHIHQGEGGEQGDPLMPLLFALGQHSALVAAAERLRDGERLMAFLDDTYIVYAPDRVGRTFTVEQELQHRAHIHLHHGKTQVWNRGGVLPGGVNEITRLARVVKPGAVVWKGDRELPVTEQGVKVLGVPIGTPEHVQEFLAKKGREQEILFQRIPRVNDPQAAWLILLMCGSTRSNFWLRAVAPGLTAEFAGHHDATVWGCLCKILGVPSGSAEAQVVASLALSAGGLGLTSARRTRTAAHWASWADCLRMVRQRHPDVAELMITHLQHGTAPCFRSVQECGRSLAEAGLQMPPWLELSESPPVMEVDPEPNPTKVGWQRQAVKQMEQAFIQNEVWPTLDDSARALMRSQHGPLASAPFTVLPTSRVMRIEAQSFRLLLCRRLRFPPPLSLRTCRCGRQLDSFGHHAACQVAGVLGRRGFPLECAAAQVYREAGARVTEHARPRHGSGSLRCTGCSEAGGSACHRHHPRIAVESRRDGKEQGS